MSEQTPEQIEQAAADDVRRADEALAALEQRVLDDDQDVTPAEIETARSARHFAGLRQRAAQKKAAKLREQQLAAERERALADARAILAEVTEDDVTAAVQAAGEAMAKLRATVRARNDVQARALARLQASPVQRVTQQHGHTRGEPLPVYPDLGHGYSSGHRGGTFLWLNGRAVGPLDEAVLMDKARSLPADRDAAEQRALQREAAARLIEQDAALYREDRAAFEQLPAYRRKPALDSLGVDWERYCDQREQALKRQVQGV
ncbi:MULTISPECIES: hypothetical protein [Streptomyces rochei group]|uniref:hypothetical protein n=1 Tax=Streptomyces rochei group TaxID=2867164 RepID=UPI001875562D|nr:hypothetical protein [Streptomyces vinaceusdrappus]GHC26981.1 hypothetical protein GCM10010308_49850 [Streptomyces vinaceusdrappus]